MIKSHQLMALQLKPLALYHLYDERWVRYLLSASIVKVCLSNYNTYFRCVWLETVYLAALNYVVLKLLKKIKANVMSQKIHFSNSEHNLYICVVNNDGYKPSSESVQLLLLLTLDNNDIVSVSFLLSCLLWESHKQTELLIT